MNQRINKNGLLVLLIVLWCWLRVYLSAKRLSTSRFHSLRIEIWASPSQSTVGNVRAAGDDNQTRTALGHWLSITHPEEPFRFFFFKAQPFLVLGKRKLQLKAHKSSAVSTLNTSLAKDIRNLSTGKFFFLLLKKIEFIWHRDLYV